MHDEIDDLGGLPPDEDSLEMRDFLKRELDRLTAEEADRRGYRTHLEAEYERLEDEYQRLKQLQDERDEAETEAELHSCGYPDNSFACKIRHQYIQHGWAKGDH